MNTLAFISAILFLTNSVTAAPTTTVVSSTQCNNVDHYFTKSQSCFKVTGVYELTDLYMKPSWEFTDSVSLKSWIAANDDSTSNAFITSMRNGYGCLGYNGGLLQYQSSFMIIQKSYDAFEQCATENSSKTVPKMCKSSCLMAADSLKSVFGNTTICSASAEHMSKRQAALNAYYDECEQMNDDSGCSLGLGMDKLNNQCGFATASESKAFCAAHAGTQCCIAAATTGPDSNANNDQVTNDAALSSTEDSQNGPTVNLPLLLGLILGTLVVCIVASVIAARYIRQRHLRKDGAILGAASTSKNTEKPSTLNNKASTSSLFETTPAMAQWSTTPHNLSVDSPLSPPVRQNGVITPMSIAGKSSQRPTSWGASSISKFSETNISASDEEMDDAVDVFAIAALAGASVNQNGKIQVPFKATSVSSYTAQLSDEISLTVQDTIEVKEVYDDGWALGINLSTHQTGIFPLICLKKRVRSDTPSRISSLFKPAGQN